VVCVSNVVHTCFVFLLSIFLLFLVFLVVIMGVCLFVRSLIELIMAAVKCKSHIHEIWLRCSASALDFTD